MRHWLPAQHVPSWVVICPDGTPLGPLQIAEHAEQVLTDGLAVAMSPGGWGVCTAVSGSVDGPAHLMMPSVRQRSVSGVHYPQLCSSVQRIALLWRLARLYPAAILSSLIIERLSQLHSTACVALSPFCGSILQDGSPHQIVIIVVKDRCHSPVWQLHIIKYFSLGKEAKKLECHRAQYFITHLEAGTASLHDASTRSYRLQQALSAA